MDKNINQYIPDTVSAPGSTLLEVLEERAISQAELALRTGRPKKTINEICQGKASITAETALQLELVLGIAADFWLAREHQYQESVARQREHERHLAGIDWLNDIPVNDLRKRLNIERSKDKAAAVGQMLSFFGVASVAQYREVYAAPQAQFRRSTAFEVNEGAIAAWLRLGELEAARVQCAPYDAAAFRSALYELREITCHEELAVIQRALVARCAAVGVAVVFIREVAGCRASGATRWLTPTKAVVQLSLRYKSNDHLWFTFFHEAAHILLHGKREVFLEGAGPKSGTEEREADGFAQDLLIAPDRYQRLIHVRPFTESAVRQLASEVGIHPAIIVGRLQHDGLLPHSRFTNLKVFFPDAA